MDTRDISKMIYRYLGNSGLKVSVLSYGNWITAENENSEQEITEWVQKCYNMGVNFFDTAEIYGFGVAETVFGHALKALNWEREDIVVSTKIFQVGHAPNDKLLSRKHLIEGVRNSLKRLQLDYVDIVFCHRPDYETPLEETCRTMDWLIEEGLCFYWATSEWPADMIQRAVEICNRLKLHRPIADQCQYNALTRDNVEKNLMECYEEYRYGTTIWSPLSGGILSGKYNDGSIPEGSRFDKNKKFMAGTYQNYFGDAKKEHTLKVLKGLEEISTELGWTQAQLVLAWTIVNQDVSSCIFGATKTSQVEDNMKALDVAANWNVDLETRIEELLGNRPELPMDFNEFAPATARRDLQVDYNMKATGGVGLLQSIKTQHNDE